VMLSVPDWLELHAAMLATVATSAAARNPA
jgi:hypothetical protein